MNIGPLHLGPFELIIILVVVLVLFGPKNLPKLGSAIGKTMHNLREGMSSGKKEKEAQEASDAADDSQEAEASVAEEAPAKDTTASEAPAKKEKPAPRNSGDADA